MASSLHQFTDHSTVSALPEAWDRQQDPLCRARAVGCTAGRVQQGSPGQSEKKF